MVAIKNVFRDQEAARNIPDLGLDLDPFRDHDQDHRKVVMVVFIHVHILVPDPDLEVAVVLIVTVLDVQNHHWININEIII